jgi:hypoxanthine phosphoribosyltransferase
MEFEQALAQVLTGGDRPGGIGTLSEYLRINGARSVRTCTLLDKPSRREVDFTSDYVGKTIPDEFVVGYGLDYQEKYRALPYVGILKRQVYEQ